MSWQEEESARIDSNLREEGQLLKIYRNGKENALLACCLAGSAPVSHMSIERLNSQERGAAPRSPCPPTECLSTLIFQSTDTDIKVQGAVICIIGGSIGSGDVTVCKTA